jgi:excisionase family DNA binding protein
VKTDEKLYNQPLAVLITAIASEVTRQLEPKLARIAPNVIQPALLTVKDAAVYLGRSEQAIQHLIFERQLPVVRHGRRVHLRRFDLDKWIEDNLY